MFAFILSTNSFLTWSKEVVGLMLVYLPEIICSFKLASVSYDSLQPGSWQKNNIHNCRSSLFFALGERRWFQSTGLMEGIDYFN